MAGSPYEHDSASVGRTGLAAAGVALAMGVPVVLIVWGIGSLGPGGIDWASAIVWGLLATAVFTLFGMMGQKMGMTDMDILDMLGSALAEPGSVAAKKIGAAMHHMNGVILAVAWAYGVGLVGLPATWRTGLAWGAILTVLTLVMMSGIGVFHPAVRAGRMRDPGAAATNYGKLTPAGSLMGHLVYGAVLGLGYQLWPVG